MLEIISLTLNAAVAIALAFIKAETSRLRREVKRLRLALNQTNNCKHKQQCPVIKNLVEQCVNNFKQ